MDANAWGPRATKVLVPQTTQPKGGRRAAFRGRNGFAVAL